MHACVCPHVTCACMHVACVRVACVRSVCACSVCVWCVSAACVEHVCACSMRVGAAAQQAFGQLFHCETWVLSLSASVSLSVQWGRVLLTGCVSGIKTLASTR